jgi:putative FmdB family regulatory protein
VPTYVYRCQECSAVIERRQSFTDDPLTVCETCGGALRKVIQVPQVVFKGPGFYSTDYRKNSGGSDTSSSSSDSDSSSTKTTETTSTESKPAETKPAESKPAATTASES